MAQQEGMTILEFQKRFSREEECRDHLFTIRWPSGFVCPQCGGQTYYKIQKRNVYECRACGHQVYLTAGTIMHKTHLPLVKWFWAIYMCALDKRGVSAARLQQELEISYPTAWLMLHKIRKAMAERDANYQLAGIVELDDSYFGAPKEGGKRGRGTKKVKVLVGVSLDKQGRPLHVKMGVVDRVKSDVLVNMAF